MATTPQQLEGEDWPALYDHKLAIVELCLSDTNEDDDIVNYYDEIITESNKGPIEGYERSDSIDIERLSIINDKIVFDSAYLHGTSVECDWSSPCFLYDERLQTWVIKDPFWGAKNGIGRNGCVTILDFNEYKRSAQ